MKAIKALSVVMSITVFALFGTPAVLAQDKGKDAKATPAKMEKSSKPTDKVLLDNKKVRVTERTYKPGDVNEASENQSSYRTNYTVNGGTLERTYADGKKQKIEVKTGMLRYFEPSKSAGDKYTTKNIGNTDVVSIVTVLK